MESKYPAGYLEAYGRFLAAADERDPIPVVTRQQPVGRVSVTSAKRQAIIFAIVVCAAAAPFIATVGAFWS